MPRLVLARGVTDAEDIAAVLHARVTRATVGPAASERTRRTPRLIAGLIPVAAGTMNADMGQPLDERRTLIEQRAGALVDAAVGRGEAWITDLGEIPREIHQAEAWRRQARAVAAYRDQYGITANNTLGVPAESTNQQIDAARARAAADRARQLTANFDQQMGYLCRPSVERREQSL